MNPESTGAHGFLKQRKLFTHKKVKSINNNFHHEILFSSPMDL